MEQLPCEILDEICRDNCLNHVDLARLSCVSKRFREVADSNDTWCMKFKLAFPTLYQLLPRRDKSWRIELKQRLHVRNLVRKEIKDMAERNYTKSELSKSDFATFDDILLRHNHESSVHLYVLDELESILDSGTTNDNLTDKFYARKCVQHVRHSILRPSISRWLELEEDRSLGYEEVNNLLNSSFVRNLFFKLHSFIKLNILGIGDHSSVDTTHPVNISFISITVT